MIYELLVTSIEGYRNRCLKAGFQRLHSRFSLLPLLLCRNSPSVRVLGKSSSSSSTTGTTKRKNVSDEDRDCRQVAAAQDAPLLQSVSHSGQGGSQAELQPSTIRLTERCCAGQHDNGPVSSSEWTEGEREHERGEREVRRTKAGLHSLQTFSQPTRPRARGPENHCPLSHSTHTHSSSDAAGFCYTLNIIIPIHSWSINCVNKAVISSFLFPGSQNSLN